MNQPANPAWQGATKVAQARLQTIEEALAKLEAAVPNVENPPVKPENQAPDAQNSSTLAASPSSATRMESEIQHAKDPAPLPASSVQALETFLSGAA